LPKVLRETLSELADGQWPLKKKPQPKGHTAEACQGKEKPRYASLVTGKWHNHQQMARLDDAPHIHQQQPEQQPEQQPPQQ
jgi:hypothetical protein